MSWPRCGGQERAWMWSSWSRRLAPPCQGLADGLMEQCTKNNYEFLRMEGYQTGQWILADLNDIVVHIFQQDVRELFRIESLWKESPALYGEMPAVSPRHAEPAGDED
ncbi:MAG: ribosome silencing factor [Bilophila wadsworthia]